MNYLSTLSDVEVEEYQASVYPESSFSVKDLSGLGGGSIVGKSADEMARCAIMLLKSGRASSVDQAVRMAMEGFCSGKGSSGLGGLVSTTADFNRLNAAQDHSIAIQSEISGIGQEAWDAAIDSYGAAIESAGWIPASDYTYDKMMAFWLAQTQRLLVYGSAWLEHRPTTEDVAEVERFATGSDQLIAFLRQYLPSDAVSQGRTDRSQTQSALASSNMRSPDDVSQAVFKEELLKNVNALSSDVTKYLLLAAGIVALALGLSRGGRS